MVHLFIKAFRSVVGARGTADGSTGTPNALGLDSEVIPEVRATLLGRSSASASSDQVWDVQLTYRKGNYSVISFQITKKSQAHRTV